MRFALMIYCKAESWGHPVFLRTKEAQALPEPERDKLLQEMNELFAEISASGELVGGEALPAPTTTRTVSVRNGTTRVADGPLAPSSEEQLAGWFILDCADRDRAEQIAARLPDAPFGFVEVRPLLSDSGENM
ncbi:YciI family protein [Streptomyces sp. NPDC059063]|uniref:YciI family protein n=1 Tax=unclassified Streptomyces TaxID=2593676 RepID=UPI0036916D3A